MEIALTIPDNEARTALATLQRLGVPAARLDRADLYCCEVEPERAGDVIAALRGAETLFNPNKHALRVRAGTGPEPGEVWVGDLPSPVRSATVRLAGRVVPGLLGIERFTAWRIGVGRDGGEPAGRSTVTAAAETLLCNPAFQRAIRA